MKRYYFTVIRNCPDLFRIMFTASLISFLSSVSLNAQKNELDVLRNNWLLYTDAPNSLYHHITGQAYELLASRAADIARLKSLSDWQQRQKMIRETFLDIIGPFPGKTPLNARIVRTLVKDFYRVEHIIYESQPGFYVTSSMFIPNGLKKGTRAPVVIYCSGHSADGYRSTVYQHVILNLVKKGFVVFAFDPVGQGERYEHLDLKTGKPLPGITEHSYSGSQAFVTGSSQAKYMIWDGIRAVDYLLTRKEIDPARIGITGRSGGGTQSSYIAAMDERIYAAAPENYITNFTRLFETIGNQDAEQNFFHGIVRGMDHADLLLVRAPKPAMMITTTRDMFSIQGAMETEKEVQRIYKAYKKEENFSRVEDDAIHSSTKMNREAMYAFFQRHLNNPGNTDDEEIPILTVDEMKITSTGQVSTSLAGETVFSLNRAESLRLDKKLQEARADLPGHLSSVPAAAKKLSGYREPSEIPEPVFSGRFQKDGYVIEKHFIKGEGEYVIPYLQYIPDKPYDKAIIYLHPSGKAAEAEEGGELEWFARKGFMVIAPDLVGVGEMGPGIYRGDAYIQGVSHNVWYASILIGRSIVGIRAGDVIRLLKLTKQNPAVKEIYGLAKKDMSPVLLHAAAFDPSIVRIALVEPYSSYASIVMNPFYISGYIHSTVAGSIGVYDLPDLAACLAPRKLLIAGTTDGFGKRSDPQGIDIELTVIRSSYGMKNAGNQLKIAYPESTEKPFDLYSDWIK
jgi:dienelactone hydrolase